MLISTYNQYAGLVVCILYPQGDQLFSIEYLLRVLIIITNLMT